MRFAGCSELPTVGDAASPACFLFSDVFAIAGVFVVPPDEIAGDDADAAACPCCCEPDAPLPDPLACGCPCPGCGMLFSCFSGEFAELDAVPGEPIPGGCGPPPGAGPPGICCCWGFVTEDGALEYSVVDGMGPSAGTGGGYCENGASDVLGGPPDALASGGAAGAGSVGPGGEAVVTVVSRMCCAILFSASAAPTKISPASK